MIEVLKFVWIWKLGIVGEEWLVWVNLNVVMVIVIGVNVYGVECLVMLIRCG